MRVRRVRIRLAVGTGLLVAAFAAVLLWYVPTRQANAAGRALEAHATGVAGVLSVAAARALAPGSVEHSGELSDSLGRAAAFDERIAYVVVLGPSGSVIAAYRESDAYRFGDIAAVPQVRTVARDDHVQVSIPLLRGDSQAGTLVAGFSTATVTAVHARARRAGALISALLLVLALAMAWRLGGQLARPVLEAVEDLQGISRDLAATARQQEASSAEEAAAVTETRRSMELLLESAQQIADQSSDVLGNAERTVRGNAQIADRVAELHGQAEKVSEILATIIQIADKADLLAVNASLEGTKAGDAGKGFALVGVEMRRLAENVTESANGIRLLVKDMRAALEHAVTASEQGAQSSNATTGSARQIARLTQDQRQATEQVHASMSEMQAVLRETMAGVSRSAKSAQRLSDLAERLAMDATPSPRNEPSRHNEP